MKNGKYILWGTDVYWVANDTRVTPGMIEGESKRIASFDDFDLSAKEIKKYGRIVVKTLNASLEA